MIEALQRFQTAVVRTAALCTAMFKIGLGLLVIAASVAAPVAGFRNPFLVLFLVVIVMLSGRFIMRAIRDLVGPPLPPVTSRTRLETRRALRRAGLLGRD
jgi:hypothetical protein